MGGLQTKYAELFSLSIEQPFYQNKICRSYQTTPVLDYTLVPSGECQQVMNRMDLVFRNTDTTGGIIVLGRVLGTNGGGDELLRFPATAADKLSFWIVLNNPNLVNFDDLPATLPTSQFYYFSNQLADIAAPRTGLHLSIDPTGVKGANDTIKRSDVTYRYHHPVPIAPNTAKIKHLLTGVSIDPYTVMNQNGQADLIFDLHTLPQVPAEHQRRPDRYLLFYGAVAAAARLWFDRAFPGFHPCRQLSYHRSRPVSHRPTTGLYYTIQQPQHHLALYGTPAADEPALSRNGCSQCGRQDNLSQRIKYSDQ